MNMKRTSVITVSKKVFLSFLIVIVVFACVSLYPTQAFKEPVNLLQTIMDNITMANDTLDICFDMQKELKDILRNYTRDPSVIEDKSIRTGINETITIIDKNIQAIKKNHEIFQSKEDTEVINSLNAYERMLNTYIEKAKIIVSADAISIGERSDSYELLLVYKDAIERGSFNFITAETEYSKTVRKRIDNLTSGINTWALSLSASAIILSFLFALFVTRSISVPIKKITDAVEQIAKGNLNVPEINVKTQDELHRLANYFNNMVVRLKALMTQIVHEQEMKRKAELEMLQGQIHPHFLYNTLDSVVRMIGQGKDEDIHLMITSLSKLFRISLSRGSITIPVKQELDHVRSYLTIQSIRYSERFTFEIISEEAVDQLYTLKLLLQPIVENAIVHGVENLMEQGHITVTAKKFRNQLVFEVKDNGLGIRPDVLKKIFTKKKEPKMGSGVALPNVKERIRLYYGNKGKIEVKSVVDEGTIVRIRIPATDRAQDD